MSFQDWLATPTALAVTVHMGLIFSCGGSRRGSRALRGLRLPTLRILARWAVVRRARFVIRVSLKHPTVPFGFIYASILESWELPKPGDIKAFGLRAILLEERPKK